MTARCGPHDELLCSGPAAPSTSRAVSFIGIRCYSAPRCERRRLESVSEFSQQQHALCAIHDRVRSPNITAPAGPPGRRVECDGISFHAGVQHVTSRACVDVCARSCGRAPRRGPAPAPRGAGAARAPASVTPAWCWWRCPRERTCVPRRSYLICETGAARAYHAHTHGEGRRSALGVPRAGRATRSDVALRKNE